MNYEKHGARTVAYNLFTPPPLHIFMISIVFLEAYKKLLNESQLITHIRNIWS